MREKYLSFLSQVLLHSTMLGYKTSLALKKEPFEVSVLVLTKVSDSNA